MIDLLARQSQDWGQSSAHERALVTISTLVGAMLLARAVDQPGLSDSLREAALKHLTVRLARDFDTYRLPLILGHDVAGVVVKAEARVRQFKPGDGVCASVSHNEAYASIHGHNAADMWSVLFLTLPTQPSAVRLRIWRVLKALGCGSLRDGVYVLPTSQSTLFDALVTEARSHGGQASVLELSASDEAQRDEVLALFDRTDAYGKWRMEAQSLAAALPALEETEARRGWRSVAESLQTLRRIDYYPGAAAEQAEAELNTLRQALDARFSRGEPLAQASHGIPRLDTRKFQGKRWVSRVRPWVDRLACAWLIRRFIDPEARFLWLADPAGTTPAPRGALGFDYDGARFTHVGALVSFEVLAASFGLDADPKLQRIARAVHYLDVGGIPVPEAAGLEAVLSGLRAVHTDDDQLILAAGAVFDALFAAPGAST